MTTLRTLITLILLLVTLLASGQINDQNVRKKILKNGIINKLFITGNWKKDGQSEGQFIYLGKLKNKTGRIFKILTASWYWGISPRATSRILVYNQKNEYVGNYYLTMTYDLPSKLQNGKLIFYNAEESDCDKKVTTTINLVNGLPIHFFRKCKGEFGDIYTFE